MSKNTGKIWRGIDRAYTLAGAAKKSARRVTTADLSPIENAALVEVSGKIAWVGEEKNLPATFGQNYDCEEINLGGAVVLPGFVESHTHLIYSGSRADEFNRRLNGESYQEIAKSGGGILSTVRATMTSSEDQLVSEAQVRATLLARQGVTTLEIKSGYGLNQVDEEKMLRAAARLQGPRIVRTYLGAHAIPSGQSAEDYINQVITNDLPRIARENLAERVDIFVESGYFSIEQSRRYLEAAEKLGLGLSLHADQLTRSGASELAVHLRAQSADHVIQISDNDVAILAASEVTAVLLPAADLYMRCAYPPARALIDQGARVALATDHNPGTSPTLDLALVGLLARLEMKMSLAEVVTAYTLGAAFALGRAQNVGSLEVGKQCDFIALSSDITGLFYTAGQMPVAQVFRDGNKIA